jgi:hypothetical protein
MEISPSSDGISWLSSFTALECTLAVFGMVRCYRAAFENEMVPTKIRKTRVATISRSSEDRQLRKAEEDTKRSLYTDISTRTNDRSDVRVRDDERQVSRASGLPVQFRSCHQFGLFERKTAEAVKDLHSALDTGAMSKYNTPRAPR